MNERIANILGLTSAHFAARALEHGVRSPTSLAMYRAAFRDGATPTESWAGFSVAKVTRSHDELGTIKFIQRHDDDLETESVILPIAGASGRMRATLCVSSQVGCAMGCTFCETAQMGLMRNLTIDQIVGQWFAASHVMRTPIDNIVFMGMGEPMDNLDAVIGAIRILCDRNGASIAPAGISVSTVGRVEGIRRLGLLAREVGFGKLRLAVSINAPNDEIRSRIMPINRSTPMKPLMDAMLEWPTGGRQRVLIEYVIIPGVNDATAHADELCEYLRPLKCTVNVIPYNPRRDSPWPAPDETTVRNFVQRVHDRGQSVKRRQTMGRSVMAACGQLGNPAIRRRKLVELGSAG
jgi:23S rRNA (adenine2503-C2)-methyltransferase